MRPVVVAGANEYRLLERVATTALGSVHRALHASSGRVVEVTLLERLADDPDGKRAFAAALPAIVALRHDNILPVENWGDSDGVPSVITPLPDAEPLAGRMATAWLPDRATALRLLREVAAAVDQAHRLGVVHGNLEPASVLVTAKGSALVANFGLTPLAGATPLPGGTGLRHGSPAHVAPERFPSGKVGPAADVYAFSVIAWQLLTGRVPPGGGLARPAAAVLERGLDRDPAARWATCGELVAALEAGLAGAAAAEPAAEPPAPAAEPAPPIEPPPSAGRLAGIPARTWLAAVGGLLLLGVLGGVIVNGERPGAPAAAASRTRSSSTPAVLTRLTPPPDTPTDTPRPAATPTPAPPPPTAVPVPVPVATVRPAPTPSRTPSPTPAGPSITVSDPNPRPGEQNVMVTGRGFDPTQQYVIYFAQGSIQPLFGPASPDRSGDFSSPVQIPSRAGSGPAVIGACVYQTNTHRIGACVQVQVEVRG